MATRRDLLLGAAATAAFAACRPSPVRAAPRIRAVAFDLFTLFDPRAVDRALDHVVPGRGGELADAWRARQFQYTWLHAAAGRYRDFGAITKDSLAFVARSKSVVLDEHLADVYTQLPPWPDATATLEQLRRAGLRLAPLANFTPRMIEALLGHGGMRGLFDNVLSTDRARTFKPDPRAYQLAVDGFGLPRASIAFSAFGGWDAAGAAWFGMPTFWVNRLGVAREELGASYATGPDLAALAAWLGV